MGSEAMAEVPLATPGAGGTGDDGTPDTTPAAGPDAAAGSREAGVPPSPSLRWDWAGIVGTGQSLSVGEQARAVAGTAQPFGNLKLALPQNGWPQNPDAAGLSMVPLVEPIRAFSTTYPSAYPQNIAGETPHTAMANQISTLAEAELGLRYVSAHTVIGENGQPMSVLRKGATEVVTGAMSMGRAYAATWFEAAAITRLARAQGLTYGVGAISVAIAGDTLAIAA